MSAMSLMSEGWITAWLIGVVVFSLLRSSCLRGRRGLRKVACRDAGSVTLKKTE